MAKQYLCFWLNISIRGPWTPFTILINGTNPALAPLFSSNHTHETVLAAEDLKIYTAPFYASPYTLLSTASWNTSDLTIPLHGQRILLSGTTKEAIGKLLSSRW
jgi:hypothetical protein